MNMWLFPLARLLGVALLASLSLFAEAASWRIDPLHSAAHFSVRHMMISRVRGEFTGINGTVLYDAQNPAQAAIEATIDCSTLNTGVAKRDAQMRGPDFFDVKLYPVMKFKSKKVEPAGPAKLKMTGDLTINATTREVILDVDGPSQTVRDPRGNERIGLNATTKFNRKDFGIVWNEIMESGGFTVADEVSIDLDIELIKNKK
jgi:polyisoprenoid-binding protein YceI